MYETPTKYNVLENDDEVDHDRCTSASVMTLRDYFAAKAMQALIQLPRQRRAGAEDAAPAAVRPCGHRHAAA